MGRSFRELLPNLRDFLVQVWSKSNHPLVVAIRISTTNTTVNVYGLGAGLSQVGRSDMKAAEKFSSVTPGRYQMWETAPRT